MPGKLLPDWPELLIPGGIIPIAPEGAPCRREASGMTGLAAGCRAWRGSCPGSKSRAGPCRRGAPCAAGSAAHAAGTAHAARSAQRLRGGTASREGATGRDPASGPTRSRVRPSGRRGRRPSGSADAVVGAGEDDATAMATPIRSGTIHPYPESVLKMTTISATTASATAGMTSGRRLP